MVLGELLAGFKHCEMMVPQFCWDMWASATKGFFGEWNHNVPLQLLHSLMAGRDFQKDSVKVV